MPSPQYSVMCPDGTDVAEISPVELLQCVEE
jgi:hypothetical protein